MILRVQHLGFMTLILYFSHSLISFSFELIISVVLAILWPIVSFFAVLLTFLWHHQFVCTSHWNDIIRFCVPHNSMTWLQVQVQMQMSCLALHKRAERIGCLLVEKGKLNIGNHVALLYPPGLELIAAFYGCLYVGEFEREKWKYLFVKQLCYIFINGKNHNK